MAKLKPDYEVTAKLITFWGTSRTEAVMKLVAFMSSESEPWDRTEDVPITTGYSTNHDHDDRNYYASAMQSYKRSKK